jgi:hypothetical protein
MKRLILAFSLFFAIPVNAAEITSKITDSVQLKVDGAAVQSQRIGSQYSVSGTNVTPSFNSTNQIGGFNTGSISNGVPQVDSAAWSVTNDGQAFTFSEAYIQGDATVTTQSVSGGVIASPNNYGNTITQPGGDKGTLAGTLSPTGVPTVTAGGAGTTATGQRSIELSVFK